MAQSLALRERALPMAINQSIGWLFNRESRVILTDVFVSTPLVNKRKAWKFVGIIHVCGLSALRCIDIIHACGLSRLSADVLCRMLLLDVCIESSWIRVMIHVFNRAVRTRDLVEIISGETSGDIVCRVFRFDVMLKIF